MMSFKEILFLLLWKYKQFIKPSKIVPSIGVSYEGNGRFVDVFNNNIVFVGEVGKSHLLKAECSSMNLNLREMGINHVGKIIYGF